MYKEVMINKRKCSMKTHLENFELYAKKVGTLYFCHEARDRVGPLNILIRYEI